MLQILSDGLKVTVFAMGIVFIALLVLMYIIRIQTSLLKDIKAKTDMKTNEDIHQAKEITHNAPANLPSSKVSNDAEIAAAIVAAICAHTNLSSDQFVIRSIKRISGNESPWRNAGTIQ